jgi:hypothetical protein
MLNLFYVSEIIVYYDQLILANFKETIVNVLINYGFEVMFFYD